MDSHEEQQDIKVMYQLCLCVSKCLFSCYGRTRFVSSTKDLERQEQDEVCRSYDYSELQAKAARMGRKRSPSLPPIYNRPAPTCQVLPACTPRYLAKSCPLLSESVCFVIQNFTPHYRSADLAIRWLGHVARTQDKLNTKFQLKTQSKMPTWRPRCSRLSCKTETDLKESECESLNLFQLFQEKYTTKDSRKNGLSSSVKKIGILSCSAKDKGQRLSEVHEAISGFIILI